MKKTFITLTGIMLLVIAGQAQKAQLGFTVGSTLSNYQAKEDGLDETANARVGFTAGLIVNIPAGKSLTIQTGAQWVQKGTKDKQGSDKVSLNVNNIEVPLNFLYNHKGLFIGAGPSVSLAASGKWKYNDLSVKTKFGNTDNDDMRGFDFGANVLAGYQSPSGLLLMANFNQGLSNLMPGSASSGTLKSHYFGLRLGYVLKSRKS